MEKLNYKKDNELLLDEYKIHKYCKQYKYKYKMYQNNETVIIETNFDSWKVSVRPITQRGIASSKLEVRHYNRSGNKKGKMQYHLQKYAQDIDYVFTDIISTHEAGKGILDSIFDLKNVFEDIKKLKHSS